jgi:dTDP-glucose pyrophosphorylase
MKKYIIKNNISILEALKKIKANKNKTLLVVNLKNQLIGSVSNAEIRKTILNKKTKKISFLMNKKPIYVKNYDIKKIKKIFISKGISLIPLINQRKEIIKIFFFEDYYNFKEKNIKNSEILTYIAAGGKGKRFLPYSKIIPKPLIPYRGKSMIEIIIDKFQKEKVSNFVVSVGYKSQMIKYFLDYKYSNKSISLSYIEEKLPMGTAGALFGLKKYKVNNIYVINCDTILNYNYNKILNFHKKNNFDVTIVVCKKKVNLKYGDCKIDNNKLINIFEKPTLTSIVNVGFYIFSKEVINKIQNMKNTDMTDLINELLKKNFKIGAYLVKQSFWKDLGSYEEIQNY